MRMTAKLLLGIAAAAGGVVAWQRRNETPPTPPGTRPSRLPASEPFMDPVAEVPPRMSPAPVAAVEAPPVLTPDELPDPASEPESAVGHAPTPVTSREGGSAEGPADIDGDPALPASQPHAPLPPDDTPPVGTPTQTPLPDPPPR